MINKEIVKRLREEIGHGAGPIIQGLLLDIGKPYSLRTINATLNEDDPRFNEEIFEVAVQYRDSLRDKAKKLERKVMS